MVPVALVSPAVVPGLEAGALAGGRGRGRGRSTAVVGEVTVTEVTARQHGGLSGSASQGKVRHDRVLLGVA